MKGTQCVEFEVQKQVPYFCPQNMNKCKIHTELFSAVKYISNICCRKNCSVL
jgi:hypothetical protein